MTTATLARLVRRTPTAAVSGARVRPSRWTVLTVLGLALMPTGLTVILLGWYGAARTPYGVEQTPYLISGGMLGLGLVLVGGFLFSGGVAAKLIERQQVEADRVIEAMAALAAQPAATAGPSYVATPSGDLAHRPTCAVVATRTDVRQAPAGLRPCALCRPY